MRLVKAAVFLAAALPLCVLVRDVFFGALAANPYPPALRATGLWSMRLLLAVMALAPLARAAGWAWPLALRRMIGLWAAFYAFLHLAIWAKDYDFAWSFLGREIVLRSFLTIGTVAAILLLPLAATSFDAARRALGARAWHLVHWAVYPATIAAYLHFMLAGRLTRAETVIDGAILAVLLLWRLASAWRRARPPARAY
jgi:sulfoxide reductase heme-binding subunit YedZ